MILKIVQLFTILIVALAGGMFWGPWIALTISIRTLTPEVFLALTQRLNHNMSAVMTILLPVALLAMVTVFVLAYPQHTTTCYFTLLSFILYLVTLLVTVLIEVPLVKQMIQWTVDTLPNNWQQVRDRWASFHIVRVIATVLGLGMLVAGSLSN